MATRAKPARDLVRLARAFSVPPTNRGAVVTITSTFVAAGALGLTMALIPATALLAGLGGYELTDRRAIAKGLRELDDWGFPVEGYRAWLLADEPTFEIELRRMVDVGVIATSAAAIDGSAAVRRIDERVVRVVTRRVALPAAKEGRPPIYLGDRRLLRELHDRILSPLHADVGIVAMRMGDRSTLAALVPASRHDEEVPPVAGMGAFRDPAMAAPPALQALATTGATSLRLTEDPGRLRFRSERVLHATGRSPVGVGTVAAFTLGGMTSGTQFGPIGFGIGLIAGFTLGVTSVITTNRRNVKSVQSLVAWHGFPVEDYDAWLISGRPLFEIELLAPPDRDWLTARLCAIEAFSTEANAMVRWVEAVTWVDDTLVRIETRPTLIQPSRGKIKPFYGGSHILFQQCLNDVLVALHAHARIRAVRMGGYVDRRV